MCILELRISLCETEMKKIFKKKEPGEEIKGKTSEYEEKNKIL